MSWSIEMLPIESEHDANASKELGRCHALRRRVFVDEQGVPPELEWDGLDVPATHFLAVEASSTRGESDHDSDLGTARLRLLEGDPMTAKAERVAVLPEARGQDIGRQLMHALEAQARHLGRTRIALNAQCTVVPFYEKLGYRSVGGRFEQAGIDHQAMVKSLLAGGP